MTADRSDLSPGHNWVIPPEGELTVGYTYRLLLVCINLGLVTYWLLPPEWTVVP